MSPQPKLIEMNDADRAAALTGPPEEVATLLLEAAEAGHAEAQLLIGQLYLDGKGVECNPVEALRWFGIAARDGNIMAMNMVGRCCEHGWGAAVDKSLAAQWYGAAAERGLDWAMYNLATLYTLGEGVSEDRQEALRLFEQAAARIWLARMSETATPAFLAKARAWMTAQSNPVWQQACYLNPIDFEREAGVA